MIRSRWKSLRDYYRNELKKIEKREGNQTEGSRCSLSGWPYMESMSFVRDQVNTRGRKRMSAQSKTSLIKCEPTENAEEVEFEDVYEDDSTTNQEEGETADTPPTPVSAVNPLECGTKRSLMPEDTHNCDTTVVKKNKLALLETTTSSAETEDSDLMFLKSLLPDIKSLPRTRRLQLRLRFQQLVCEAVEEMEATTSVSYNSGH